MENNPHEWFWAHRRNASLHHFSFLLSGLKGKGWQPAADFWFDNQIVIGVPGKGCYIFYDRHDLSFEGKYKNFVESVLNNKSFSTDFRRRTDEIFGAIFFRCMAIDEANLSLLAPTELRALYNDLLSAVMVAPIITIQLWGIEALLDDSSVIMVFLRDELAKHGKLRELQYYREMLSVNTGETVATTEQKDFYRIAQAFELSPIREKIITVAPEKALKQLPNYPEMEQLFDKHIRKYEWLSKEYVGEGWDRAHWMSVFQEAIRTEGEAVKKLHEIEKNFQELNDSRNKAIKELVPPAQVLHLLDALRELIAQRDWTKGYFTRTLLSYHKLLGEVARRMNTELSVLFSYSYTELDEYLASGKVLSTEEITSRQKDGFVIIIKGGAFALVTGKDAIANTIESEGLFEPFTKYINVTSFKGTPASRGIYRGRARVIEDATLLRELHADEILVTYMTTIEFTPAFRIAKAVITDEGGMSSHAAIISREFKIPCVVGTKIATRAIKTGDLVEIDGGAGTVMIIESAPE